MGTADVLLVVLLFAATVVCGFAVWALRETAEAARSFRSLTDDARSRLIPLTEKVDVTVDAINAELLRVDAIITQVEEASARVSHASGTISDIVHTPAELVNDVAERVRRAWKDRRRAPSSEAQECEQPADQRTDAGLGEDLPPGDELEFVAHLGANGDKQSQDSVHVLRPDSVSADDPVS